MYNKMKAWDSKVIILAKLKTNRSKGMNQVLRVYGGIAEFWGLPLRLDYDDVFTPGGEPA